MALLTKYFLAEQIRNLIEGGTPGVASSISLNQIKASIAQVLNNMLKIDYLSVNTKLGETIPNGGVLGLYEGIVPTSTTNGRSKCTLPIKPLKLPRNMGVWSVFMMDREGEEFIPIQMGQYNLIKSQALIDDLLGQIGYENFGMEVVFTKDLPLLFPDQTVSMRLAILDISLYDDYTILPIPGEWEWPIVKEVYQLYSTQPIPDRVVDATVKEEKGINTNQQQKT